MDNSTLAPIALFVYNRPANLKKTIEALKKNYLAIESDLIIFSDGWKNEEDKLKVKEVRDYLKTISGFKSITISEKEKNYGLAKSLISGINNILSKNDKVIVFEDDLITSSYALQFLNDSLCIYESDLNVATIHCHNENISEMPELFFYNKSGCLVWGTWARAWKEVSFDGKELLNKILTQNRSSEFDLNNAYPYTLTLQDQIEGKNNSWAILVYASFFLKNMLTLYPGESLAQHIGYDGGTHYIKNNKPSDIDGILTDKKITARRIPIETNHTALKKIELFYKDYYKSKNKLTFLKMIGKIKRKLLKILCH